MTLLQVGAIVGGLAMAGTAPMAWAIATLFGLGWGVAYAVLVSFLCTWLPLQRWRRHQRESEELAALLEAIREQRREIETLMANASKIAWRDTVR